MAHSVRPMSFRLQVTRMIGFCLAGGALLGLAVQPQIQARTQASTSSENAPGDNRNQVAGKARLSKSRRLTTMLMVEKARSISSLQLSCQAQRDKGG